MKLGLQSIGWGVAFGAITALVLDVTIAKCDANGAKLLSFFFVYYGLATLGFVPALAAAFLMRSMLHFCTAALAYLGAFAAFFNLGAGFHQNFLLISGTFYYIIPKSVPVLLGALLLGLIGRLIASRTKLGV